MAGAVRDRVVHALHLVLARGGSRADSLMASGAIRNGHRRPFDVIMGGMTALQTLTKGPLARLVSIPERKGDEALPLLCFLHGYDEGAPMPIERALTLHGPLRPGNPERVRRDFIIVAPQLPFRGDAWLQFADAVRDMVTSMQAEHGADPARTYLTGFSFGGNGVFELGNAQPDLWAALWAVDPTRAPTELPRPLWLSVGEIARRRLPTLVGSLGLQPDTSVENDRVYVDRGEDHVQSATAAYGSEEPYAWLLHRERRRAPRAP
jgi:hypothetical protein